MSTPVLHVEHITMQFGGVVAVNDLSMDIYPGEIVALIGPNGAGKTTAFNCITGVYEPTNGRVDFMGEPIVCNHPRGKMKKSYAGAESERYLSLPTVSYTPDKITKRGIARTFQNIRLFKSMTVFENVLTAMHVRRTSNVFSATFRANHKEEAAQREKALELLKIVGLDDVKDELATALPYGKQRRLEIARALATHPKILLCDEATSALDPQTTQSILSLIRDIHDRLGITVIVITHQMSVVEQICTKVAILDNGTVAEEGAVSDVFSAPKSKAAKALVYPDGYDQDAVVADNETVVRIVFNGSNATKTPLIAQMAIDENIAASILSASTRSIGEKAYGNMLLGIPGGRAELERAIAYLTRIPDIYVEEVTSDDK